MFWYTILNETSYPADFSKNTHDIVRAEYPYPGAYTGSDSEARGHEQHDVMYAHPMPAEQYAKAGSKPFFTREWGDNVDDWSSHNSPSRVARNWGEAAQLTQLFHYARPYYPYSCFDSLYRTPPQHVGGCLWHPFDHQRGYHPDPFYGGILDAFRQPKASYWLFCAERNPAVHVPGTETGPFIRIVHEMTPFSPRDVTILSNCDEVRVTLNGGAPTPVSYRRAIGDKTVKAAVAGGVQVIRQGRAATGIPYPPITLENAFDFMQIKDLHRTGNADRAGIVAEGLIGGKVVARHEVRPALRSARLVLEVDRQGIPLVADGSDWVPVVASVVDARGTVKRLNEGAVRFTVTGDGSLVGDAAIGANPRAIGWGTAPALVRSTGKPGTITVRAEPIFAGINGVAPATLSFESIPPPFALAQPHAAVTAPPAAPQAPKTAPVDPKARAAELREVERQQAEFEGKPGGTAAPVPPAL
jgi:beta-galactosidase